MSTCRFCGCDPSKDSLAGAIRKLKDCRNCQIDLTCEGNWTGYGLQALRDLIKIWGKEMVSKKWG